MRTLNRKQLKRQDFVDNAIFEVLNLLNPSKKRLDWDIEIIGEVRDAIGEALKRELGVKEQTFYPSIKI